MSALILRGDARRLPLADNSVDLIVTSPPYYSQRSYTDGGQHYDGQIGSEPTPAEYIGNLIDCTREWARVLKPAGSCFVNLGDKYNSAASGQNGTGATTLNPNRGPKMYGGERGMLAAGIRTKSLMLLPERYRIACVDQLGLIARAVICWSKLPRRIIQGWSPSGICTACGEGRRPVVDTIKDRPRPVVGNTYGGPGRKPNTGDRGPTTTTVVGEVCGCPDTTAPTRPAVVVDPFGGTGTTALVAHALGRTGITVDMSADYCRLAAWRTSDRGELAKAMRVEQPPKQVNGQADLFADLLEEPA